jgi:hypothetical protein
MWEVVTGPSLRCGAALPAVRVRVRHPCADASCTQAAAWRAAGGVAARRLVAREALAHG